MLGNLIKSVFPAPNPHAASERYALYLSQQAAHHHFDSLRLAMGVLEFDAKPQEQAEWLLRVEEAADKCAAAIEECTSDEHRPS